MKRLHWSCGVGCLVIVISGAGVALAAEPAAVPVGTWKGKGTFVSFQRRASNVDRTSTGSGAYETSLTISRKRLFGTDALVLEIRSKGGDVMGIGERHLKVALVKLESLDNGSTLYGVAGVQLLRVGEESGWDDEAFRRGQKYATAVCMRREKTLVLQVHYGLSADGDDDPMAFHDTFEFGPDGVRKRGTFAQYPFAELVAARFPLADAAAAFQHAITTKAPRVAVVPGE